MKRSQLNLGALTAVLALACGLSVANIYYAQPVLAALARSFHVSEGSVTFVVTLSQVGYVLGLVFVLPLGDLIQVRRLTPAMLVVAGVALAVAGVAPSLVVFMISYLVIGIFSTVAQMLVPFAAHLAPEESRGEIVGRVMSGLLLGILLARTVSSEVAALLGWRAIFYISAGLMLALALVLARYLPDRAPDHHAGYGSLMRSVGHYAVTLGPAAAPGGVPGAGVRRLLRLLEHRLLRAHRQAPLLPGRHRPVRPGRGHGCGDRPGCGLAV